MNNLLNPPVAPPVEESLDKSVRTVSDRNPSNWDIALDKNTGDVTATNFYTKEIFKGHMDEFNAAMRG
jgi:hypothetical protein